MTSDNDTRTCNCPESETEHHPLCWRAPKISGVTLPTDEIARCPHGHEARIINIGGKKPYSIYISPDHRCANAGIGWFDNRGEAIAAWNKAMQSTSPTEVGGLREALITDLKQHAALVEVTAGAGSRSVIDRAIAALSQSSSPVLVDRAVSQADREAAAAIVRAGACGVGNGNKAIASEIAGGLHDEYLIVRAFAQHRQSALAIRQPFEGGE